MMNIVALCLVVTSLATAGVLSPSPSQGDEVVVAKEGLKVVVVEYEKEGTGKTKVSFSPDTADKIHNEEASSNKANAKKVICDAFGKCTHKLAGAFSKAKEKAHDVEEAVGGAFEKGKEVVSRKVNEMEECHQVACDKTKDALKTAIDTGKTLEGDVRRNVSEDLDIIRRHVASKAKDGLETAETAADKVKGMAKDKAKEGLEIAETEAHKVKDMVKDKENKAEHLIKRMRDFARDSSTYAVAAVSSSIGSLLGVIHLLGFAMAYGMSVWITFVSSYVLATALPRQQFGMVQSKIYPLYFRAMAYSIGMTLLGHVLSQRSNIFHSMAEFFQGYNLIASLLMVFANLLYLEPQATKVIFERMKVEKEESRGKDASSFISEPTGSVNTGKAAAATTSPTTATKTTDQEAARSRIVGLNERLKKLNSFSSTLNILTLMSLTWHLVYLGQRLHMSSCR